MERFYPRVSFTVSKPISTSKDSSKLCNKAKESKQHRQSEGVDISSLPVDPGERLAIQKYHPNDQDEIRRDNGWDLLFDEVSKFCIKYDIVMPQFDELYVILGRSGRLVADYTVLHHYHVKVFCRIIDWQLQELNNRFDEVTTDLLLGVACLNPVDSFSSFDIDKILRLTELYPDDFDKYSMVDLYFQLENYIVDVRDRDKRFSDLKGLGDLSKKLVETMKHGVYHLVFRLVKFSLLLPVATATVERAFSAMKLIKSDLRNRMDDEFLNGCLVPYIEKDVFSTFQKMKDRREEL